MNGVTILDEFAVVTKTVFSWESFWWVAFIGVVIGLITAIVCGLQEANWSAFFFGLFFGLGVYCTLIGLLIVLLNGFVMNSKGC